MTVPAMTIIDLAKAAELATMSLKTTGLGRVVIWVGDPNGDHKELIPQAIARLAWVPVGVNRYRLEMELDDVPLDATWFMIRKNRKPVLVDRLYGTGQRRFYELPFTFGPSGRGTWRPG